MISTLCSQIVSINEAGRSDESKLRDLPDKLLLQKIAQGNPQAFWQLWLRYQDYLFRCCQKWTYGNAIDAEDLLSQASLKAWEKLPDHAHKIINVKAWLARLTHNLGIDIYRAKDKAIQNTPYIDEIPQTEDNFFVANLSSPESSILRRELIDYLRQGINTLPLRLREPLTLLYYYQMSYREISQRLMISQNNVYKRISQARIILHRYLQKYSFEINQFSSVSQEQKKDKDAKTSFYQSEKSNNQLLVRKFPTLPENSRQQINLSNLSAFSDVSTSLISQNLTQVINYQVTALCLDSISPVF